MLFNFDSEEEAKKAAEAEIFELLSKNTYNNPDKFSQLIDIYRKKQKQIDADLDVTLKQHVEGISNTKIFLEEASENVMKIKCELMNLNKSWMNENDFHNDMKLYDKILIFRKNIKILLDQLNDLMNMSVELKELELLFNDPANFDYVQNQLEWLLELKETIKNKFISDSVAGKEKMKQIMVQFDELDKYYEQFYSNIFAIILNFVNFSTRNSDSKKKLETKRTLVRALKIIENADNFLIQRGNQPIYQQKCKNLIQKAIEDRFNNQIKGAKELADFISAMNFTVKDLIDVYDNVAPCFPKNYNIFDFFEENYKICIEKHLMPYLEQTTKIKEEPGGLILLASWLDSHELLIKKAGLNEAHYTVLKYRIKEYMPDFLEHLEKVLNEWLNNRKIQDELNLTEEYLKNLDESNKEISTEFPLDLFSFIHTQLYSLGEKVQGEMYIEILRIWATTLINFEEREKQNLVTSLNENSLLRVVAYMNNYYRCAQTSAKDTKTEALRFAPEESHERIEKIIIDITKSFANSCQEFLKYIVRLSFIEIERDVIPALFTLEWIEDERQLIAVLLATMDDYFGSFQKWFLGPTYYKSCVRQCFEYLLEIYIERFLVSVNKAFHTLGDYRAPRLSLNKLKKAKKEKKEKKQKKNPNIVVLTNSDTLIKCISRDVNLIKGFANEKYANCAGKPYLDKIDIVFGLLFNLIKIPKCDFESQLRTIFDQFGNQGNYILNAILSIREDCDTNFKKDMNRIYVDFIAKK